MDKKRKGDSGNEVAKKPSKIILSIIIIILAVSLMWAKGYLDDISLLFQEFGIIKGIILLVVLFAIVLFVTYLNLQKVKRFRIFNATVLLSLLFFFFIPMTVVIILFLGALHGYYGYESTFFQDTLSNFDIVKNSIVDAFLSPIHKLYLMGENRPLFYLIFSALVTIFLFFQALTKAREEAISEMNAQEIIDSVNPSKELTDKELKNLEMFIKGKMRAKDLKRFKRQLERNENKTYITIDINKLKGGNRT